MNQPYRGALTVTKSDSTVFAAETRGVYVGGTGDVAVTMFDKTTVVFKSVPDGALLPIAVTQILSTNTTATNMLALF